MMPSIELDVTSIDFFRYDDDDDVMLRLWCGDGTSYEMNMPASWAYSLGCSIADRSEDILRSRKRRSHSRAYAN